MLLNALSRGGWFEQSFLSRMDTCARSTIKRVGKTVVRSSRVGTAIAMLMTFSALAACTSGQDSRAGASEEATTAGVQDKPLSKADLERAAITDKDLDGYEINRILAAPRRLAGRRILPAAGPSFRHWAEAAASQPPHASAG